MAENETDLSQENLAEQEQLTRDIRQVRHDMNNGMAMVAGVATLADMSELLKDVAYSRCLAAVLLGSAEIYSTGGEIIPGKIKDVLSYNLWKSDQKPDSVMDPKYDLLIKEQLTQKVNLIPLDVDQNQIILSQINAWGLTETLKQISDLKPADANYGKLDELLSQSFVPLSQRIKLFYSGQIKQKLGEEDGDYFSLETEQSVANLQDLLEAKEPISDFSVNDMLIAYNRSATSILSQEQKNYLGDLAPSIQIKIPDEDLVVHAKSGQLVRVFNNLLANSIKYSPADKGYRPDITVSLKKEGDHVLIDWKDQGIGISKEDLPRVFDQGVKIENEDTAGIHSTGLGLSGAKSIIEEFGGRIWAESEGRGMGTTIKIELPLVEQIKIEASPELVNA